VEISQLLQAWSDGDQEALGSLTSLVYQDLHRLAHHYMVREDTGHSLQTTALIDELYLRLVGLRRVNWQNRAHFFAVCAQLMRRVLVDFARSQRSLKRGGGAPHLSLDEAPVLSREPTPDLLALDEALNRLAAMDERKSKVVGLRFFGGLNIEEAAEVLKVSTETVMRDWRLAKAWLSRELSRQ